MGASLGTAKGLILRYRGPEVWGCPELGPALSPQPRRRGSSRLLPAFARLQGWKPAVWQLLTLCIPLLCLPAPRSRLATVDSDQRKPTIRQGIFRLDRYSAPLHRLIALAQDPASLIHPATLQPRSQHGFN